MYIPPMIIFKGQRLNKGLVTNAPSGTLFATSKSSFIDRELFEHWFKHHFMKYLPSLRPVLLIMDGHTSHISLEILKLAKENEIEVLCLPPHTTNELQPLDKCLFKPLKTEYNKACMQFMKENPGQVITRYDFCGLFTSAYRKVCTMINAASAFRSTGIFPFNPSAISEDVFAPSTVSQLPYPGGDHHTDKDTAEKRDTRIQNGSNTCTMARSHTESEPQTESEPSTSTTEIPPATNNVLTNLLKVPTFYKEEKTVSNKRSRRITTARCLTSDEVINMIEEKENEKEQKRIEKENRKQLREAKMEEKKRQKNSKMSKKGKSKRRMATNEKADKENSSENFCNHCGGYYFDDDSDDEDWIKCSEKDCNLWFHETCTGSYGKGLDTFKCDNHENV